MDHTHVIARFHNCALHIKYMPMAMRSKLGLPTHEPCRAKSPPAVEVFVAEGAAAEPASEKHVLFRRAFHEAIKDEENIYNHIEGYAKDLGVQVPPVAEIRAWIQATLRKCEV